MAMRPCRTLASAASFTTTPFILCVSRPLTTITTTVFHSPAGFSASFSLIMRPPDRGTHYQRERCRKTSRRMEHSCSYCRQRATDAQNKRGGSERGSRCKRATGPHSHSDGSGGNVLQEHNHPKTIAVSCSS